MRALHAAILLLLTIGPAHAMSPYDREEWMPNRKWADVDKDCQTTRHEVLIRDSTCGVQLSPDTCKVIMGCWACPYTGQVFTDPKDLHIDHVVALSEAHQSGGWAWSSERKQAFANYLDEKRHLRATEADANRKKKDHPPDEWLPFTNVCQYLQDRFDIKKEWGLLFSADELKAYVHWSPFCEEP